MRSSTVDEIYEKYVRPLTYIERLQLLERTAHELAEVATEEEPHSILELRGLGKTVWEGVDPEEYVDQLREEWDGR